MRDGDAMSGHTATADPRDAATRFFWAWLIGATAASILGNVAHALLNVNAASPAIAAAAAVVPPVVQLGAGRGVHVLVRSRIIGAAYWVALAVTVTLALCAFILSFAALRDLATVWAGMPPTVAWLWPLTIDLSITGSTVALLALTGAQRTELTHEEQSAVAPVSTPVHVSVHTIAQAGAQVAAADAHVPHQYIDAAEVMLDEGVTRIDRVKVAQVLHEQAEGTAPSMIARKLNVGYNTVVRILEHPGAQIAADPGFTQR